ncbi:OsmC family protein, partial [Georgenia sp. 10Sc9-8]|nr:OsmC family protein [Georgenia halotolerans]
RPMTSTTHHLTASHAESTTDDVTASAPARTTDPTPRLKHVRAAGTWRGAMTTSLHVRDFAPFATGEPEAVGGDDSAPTPMEYVAAALNGCLVVVTETVARELGIALVDLAVDTDATMDTRGFAGTAEVPPYFTHVAVTVLVTTTGIPAQVEELRAQVQRRCPALTLIAAAGVPVDAEWLITPADGGTGAEA